MSKKTKVAASVTGPVPGDVVMLKSGGPNMTVTVITEERVSCMWFDDNHVRVADFLPVTVVVGYTVAPDGV